MISGLRRWILKEQFLPSPLGIFVNPHYIGRRDLFLLVGKYAPQFHGRLLDFGCGRKPYRGLFCNVRDANYIGVDIEESGHAAEYKMADVFYDGARLPFPDAYFDGAFSSEVFEHVPNLDEMLKEIRRVLKPRARILVTMPFAIEEHEIPYDFRRFTSFGISRALRDDGFLVLEQDKGSGTILTIAQLWTSYWFRRWPVRQSAFLKLLVTIVFAAPIHLLAYLVHCILPKDTALFTCNVVLAEKE